MVSVGRGIVRVVMMGVRVVVVRVLSVRTVIMGGMSMTAGLIMIRTAAAAAGMMRRCRRGGAVAGATAAGMRRFRPVVVLSPSGHVHLHTLRGYIDLPYIPGRGMCPACRPTPAPPA